MKRLQQGILAIIVALANGYLLFFYSERLFWALPRPDDHLTDLAVTALFYSLTGYLFLSLVRWLRVNRWYTLLLLGAIYGWLVEGIWAWTLYGLDASSPFPLSILVTGVNWHALLTVLFGWWLVARALRHPNAMWTFAAAVAMGLFWGLWATFERFESPPIVPGVADFALHAAAATALLIVSYWLLARLRLWAFEPSRVAVALIVAIHLLWFGYVEFYSLGLGWFAVALLSGLLLIFGWLLWLARVRSNAATLLDDWRNEVKPVRYLVLLLAPLLATAIYAFSIANAESWPAVHQWLFGVTVVAAMLGLCVSIVLTIRDAFRFRKAIA